MIDALAARMSGAAPGEAGRPWMHLRFVELLATRLGCPGERDPDTILARAAHTTSDLPAVLGHAANKVFLGAYSAQQPTYRAWAKKISFKDFKPHGFYRTSDFPDLAPLSEAGEIKAGSLKEAAVQLSLETRARRIHFSRQAIINDDLGAIGAAIAGAARAAARAETTMAYASLLANSGDGPTIDGSPMFTAARGNLAASGGAPDVTALGVARTALRTQKTLDGVPLNLAARVLLVGPDRETEAEKVLATIQPTAAEDVNPFSGRLIPVTDAMITGPAWWVFADPAVGANFGYGFLDGAEAPAVAQATPFNMDGIGFRVVHDFAFGPLDHRFGFRNGGQ